jgi:hypothetical protein
MNLGDKVIAQCIVCVSDIDVIVNLYDVSRTYRNCVRKILAKGNLKFDGLYIIKHYNVSIQFLFDCKFYYSNYVFGIFKYYKLNNKNIIAAIDHTLNILEKPDVNDDWENYQYHTVLSNIIYHMWYYMMKYQTLDEEFILLLLDKYAEHITNDGNSTFWYGIYEYQKMSYKFFMQYANNLTISRKCNMANIANTFICFIEI